MTLTEEWNVLADEWTTGQRDVGTARRLLYLIWYLRVEPSSCTGVETLPNADALWPELVSIVSDSAQDDFESALVFGYLVWFAPWVFGVGETGLPKARVSLEKALHIARRDGRTTDEIELIAFYLRAAAGKSRNVPPPDNEGCFPDMFLGDSGYDEYFSWIFSGRSTDSGEGLTGPSLDLLLTNTRERAAAPLGRIAETALPPWTVSGVVAFSVLGLLVSLPCLCRQGVGVVQYASVFYIIVLVRLVYGILRRNLRPIDYLVWVGSFIAFCIVAEYL
jgi:hypothetical protein